MNKVVLVLALVLAGCAGQEKQVQEEEILTPQEAAKVALAKHRVVDKPIDPIPTVGTICPDLVGTWYSDTTARIPNVGRQRDIVLIKRRADSSVSLKIVTVFFGQNKILDREAEATWSCDGQWYREQYETGELEFKILSADGEKTVLRDVHNTLQSIRPKRIIEKQSLPLPEVDDRALRSKKIRAYLELPALPDDLFNNVLP